MATRLDFIKMHGIGNDFVVIDCMNGENDYDYSTLAKAMCDRHFGVGADGLLVIQKSNIADAAMRIFNSDGSEAQMCGNGIRCIAKYIYDNCINRSKSLTIDTAAGIKQLELHTGKGGKVDSVTVDMGKPSLNYEQLECSLDTSYGRFNVIPVSMGNPHGVVFVPDLKLIDIPLIGSTLENHSFWSDKANIEFVELVSPHRLNQLTWERGVGETLACGTGACAAATAAVASRRCEWPVEIKLAGGVLSIDFNPSNGHLLMTGSTTSVFSGTYSL